MQRSSMDYASSSFGSNRWIATVASIWIQAVMGGTYAFSVYSPVLKSSQSYDQSTLDTVSVFKDIGGNAGILAGVLYAAFSYAPRHPHGGPWLVLAAGAILCFLGYFFVWLSVVGLIPRPPVPVMCLFMFIAAQSQTFFNTANVVTGVLNFPDHSGTIVGTLKAFLGLTGAILIQLYQAFFVGKPSTFILMLALLPSILTFSLMFLVRNCRGGRVDDNKNLIGFSIVALVLAGFLMVVIILENIFEFSHWAHLVTIGVLLLLLASPLKIAVEATSKEESQTHFVERKPLVDVSYSNIPEDFAHERNGQYDELPGTSKDILPAGENMNILEAMCSLNFWLLFVAVLCGMGSGLATINNMSQIAESLGYDSVRINTLVSLWSVWNVLGRCGAGYISDILLHQKGWARPLMMAVTLATMAWGHLIIASGFLGNLYIGTILVGICYGAQWSLMPTITSELFGVVHMGTIYNTIAVANPLGTYILSVWVIGRLYDKAAGDGKSCFGNHCFNVSFYILVSVSFMGFLIALMLFFRTREFYKSVVMCRRI